MFSFATTLSSVTLLTVLTLVVGALLLIASGQSRYRRPVARVASGLTVAALLAGTIALTWNLKEPAPGKKPVQTPVVQKHDPQGPVLSA